MTDDLMTYQQGQTSTASSTLQSESASATNVPEITGFPAAIPSAQAYYWTGAWQRDIKEALDALNRGDFVEFSAEGDDPSDVVRWLLDVERE